MAGVNYIDTYQPPAASTRSTCRSCSGRRAPAGCAALGAGDTGGFAVGDRVAWANASGGYAELVVVPADDAVAVPDAVPDDVAVGALLQGMTAHFLVTDCAPVGPATPCSCTPRPAGSGCCSPSSPPRAGARVMATVSTAEKEELARGAGAAEVLRYHRGRRPRRRGSAT